MGSLELSFGHDPCDDPCSPFPPSDQSIFPFNGERLFDMSPWIHMEASNMTRCVDAKLVCKHKGLIPDSNVKACQPI